MSEGGLAVRGTIHSPDSDCNSNHRESVNCLSNASSQDIDFIQDNSDYQWFLDYGYENCLLVSREIYFCLTFTTFNFSPSFLCQVRKMWAKTTFYFVCLLKVSRWWDKSSHKHPLAA